MDLSNNRDYFCKYYGWIMMLSICYRLPVVIWTRGTDLNVERKSNLNFVDIDSVDEYLAHFMRSFKYIF